MNVTNLNLSTLPETDTTTNTLCRNQQTYIGIKRTHTPGAHKYTKKKSLSRENHKGK